MTDRELLELAAKAAGYELTWGEKYIVGGDEVDCTDMPYVVSGQPDEADWYWNPLTDDGDALQLAVKLEISIDFDKRRRKVWANTIELASVDYGDDPYYDDPCYDATRRAIVLAAAEIGKGMK